MNTVYIYVLKDQNNNIRYVGKTTNVKRRLYSHIAEAKLNKSKRYVLNYWEKYWKDTSDSLPPSQNRKKSSYSLDHYNDIGAMNDLTFQDVYGDFGY